MSDGHVRALYRTVALLAVLSSISLWFVLAKARQEHRMMRNRDYSELAFHPRSDLHYNPSFVPADLQLPADRRNLGILVIRSGSVACEKLVSSWQAAGWQPPYRVVMLDAGASTAIRAVPLLLRFGARGEFVRADAGVADVGRALRGR